jgi:hypothetical protein
MNLYEKINAIMGEVKSLQKDGRIAFGTTKYNYLSEAKTTETLREQFVKYKVAILPISSIETKDGSVTHGTYAYRMLNCEEPSEYIDLMACGQGHDSADKGSGKASSYAYKYLLWRTFAIPSNDDPDQVSSDEIEAKSEIASTPITVVQANALIELAKNKGSDVSAICKAYKVDSVLDMSTAQWVDCQKKLQKK